MPPKGKRNAANTHDKRHENGLAAPGKRIPKQRSNPALHGLANGKPPSSSPPLPPPDLASHASCPAPGNAAVHATLPDTPMPDDRRLPAARGRTVSEASHDASDAGSVEHANGTADSHSRLSLHRAAVHQHRSQMGHKGSTASTAMTIISSCPVWDVVAILIILLQLPSTVLTVIHLLFATLTFVPPSSTASLSSLPSFSEVFKGSQGMPSLGTIVLCDLFALIIWGFLPMFAQGVAFDLAQAVIAISLGGAAAGKGGVSQSVLVCGGIIFFSHAYRHRSIRHYVLRYLHFVLSRGGFDIFTPPPSDSIYPESPHVSHGWPRSANSTDVNHIGNVHFKAGEDRVWVLDVGATEITFGASVVEKSTAKENGGEEQESSLGAGIDKSKPFYVRLNGTNWASTYITSACQDQKSGDGAMSKWSGKIFGLTSQQNYKCEFVRTDDRITIHSTSLITQAAPSAEQASAVSPPAHQTLRPQSPRTLLRNNVTNLEHELQELKMQQKRNQRSHGKALAAAKKEVDAVEGKIQTSGGNDDRLKQKKRQLSEAIRQAEEAASDMSTQNSSLANIPEEDLAEFKAEERNWRKEKDRLTAATEELDRCKAEADKEVTNAESEYASIVKKRERLQARQAKLNEQHERLSSLNAQDQDAQTRKLNERAALMATRAQHESQYLSQILNNEHNAMEIQNKTMYINQQIQHLQALLQQPQNPSPPAVPTTPEGPLPGTTGNAAHNFTPVFHFPPLAGQINGTPGSLTREGRGRSSSMLSDMSGFTDHNVDPPPAYAPIAAPNFSFAPGSFGNGQFGQFNAPIMNGTKARKGSSGSSGGSGTGSGSGSAPGSQRDPTSPVNKTSSPVGSATVPVDPGFVGGP
ncbi:putative ubiquitination network signaling [Botryosphaeria dothidea]|uniref:Putative ubiquitination network signaling n=1 Tax=Botryosphaeria dothidea TaxID=55169 RepID=A0A8H4MZX5_9PEZI|nr:putative ubiquitination network signaling [Botryosphaeria dothidea]KAF4304871.1 putative ubiquitination network signaling [Botryosphaeria dothidea]